MVDSLPITGEEHFVEMCTANEDNNLNPAQLSELWDLWGRYETEFGDVLLIVVPEWFSENEFDAERDIRRPLLFGQVEHDDPDSGAVLFSEVDMVDISVVENEALGKAQLAVRECVDRLDISADDDYIDESGKVWIPRSLMTIYERAG